MKDDTRKLVWLAILPICIFIVITARIHLYKIPWVDECYTYYGISHESFNEFLISICSGINFSPPLYFYINWVVQLIHEMPLEYLRIESAAWVTIGAFMIFCTCAKECGITASFLSLCIVLFQSDLLLEQSSEARQYAMFYASSCMLLYSYPNSRFNSNSISKNKLYAISLIILGLIHYLGIIYCVCCALVRFLQLKKDSSKWRLLIPEISCIIILTIIYCILLHNQTSHLNTWIKDNSLKSLIRSYFGTIQPLSLLILIIPCLCLLPVKKEMVKKYSNYTFKPRVVICALWVGIPLLFWIVSQLSSLNLFKDRYFIPKEAAFAYLLCHLIQHYLQLFSGIRTKHRVYIMFSCLIFCSALLVINSKRMIFSLMPKQNYYSKLLLKNELMNNNSIKVFKGDHIYFPNAYLHKNKDSFLLVSDHETANFYSRFQKGINVLTSTKSISTPFVLVEQSNKNFITLVENGQITDSATNK